MTAPPGATALTESHYNLLLMLRRPAPFVLLVAAVFVMASLAATPQEEAKPDLTGTWVLNPAKSKVPKKVALDPETVVIKYDGASITIAFSFSGKQQLDTFVTDGKEHAQNVGSGGQLYSKAQWKKSVLFTQTGGRVTAAGIGTADILTDKQRWSISPDGLVLTRELEDPKEILVYDKRHAE